MASFKLTKPIEINGEKVTELTYDFEEMTANDKARATKIYKKAGNTLMVQELDSDYHLFLFVAAVRKVNEGIEVEDVLRISAKDSCRAETLVRDFFFLSSDAS